MPGVPPTGGDIIDAAAHGRYYSAKDLANLARDAGFRDDTASNDGQPVASGKVPRRDGNGNGRRSELHVAIAVALAESGGDSRATGPPIEHGTAKGLWQIYPADESMFDAEANAQAAWNKYVGAGYSFTPWSVFNNGGYLAKLPAAFLAVKSTHRDRPGWTGGGTGAVHDVIAFTGNVGHDVAAFFGWITSGQTWIRLGEVVGGAILLLLALYLLFTHTSIGKDVRSVATKGAM